MTEKHGFEELADGVFRRHYPFLSLNIGVVIGEEQVLLVDSRESHEAAAELRDELRALTPKPVGWMVNSHWHWDHSFGNAVFPAAAIWGHTRCRRAMIEHEARARLDARRWMPQDRYSEIDAVHITPPTETFDQSAAVDVGGTSVELSYHGRAHTDNDILVRVAGITFAGDIVEESGNPYMGDAYLLDWPETIDAATHLFGDQVVPGHGRVIDRDFVAEQRDQIAAAAALLSEVLAGRDPDDAAAAGPFSHEEMRQALARGVEAHGTHS